MSNQSAFVYLCKFQCLLAMKKVSNIKMVALKSVLFLIGFIIHITIQKRSNPELLHAIIKEFQMKSPLLVSTNNNHDFTLAKNIMAKTQLVKIVTKIPDKIVPSSSILLNNIDTKVEAAYPKGEANDKFSSTLAITKTTSFV